MLLAEGIKRLAQKAGGATRTVINAFADLRLNNLNDCADERTRSVILAAVATGVAHPLDLIFVELREFVLLRLRAETQLVDVINDLAKVIPALNLVLNFSKDFPDLVFDRVRPSRALFETVQIGKKLLINEVAEVVAGKSF